MRHLMSPLDFSVEELDQLMDLANGWKTVFCTRIWLLIPKSFCLMGQKNINKQTKQGKS